MSTFSRALVTVPAGGRAGPKVWPAIVAAFKRWWVARLERRLERIAIAQLWAMSDRDLKDIGLTRSGIPGAVAGENADRRFGPWR